MKQFHVTVMSIDPMDKSEDNHQKYGETIEAKTVKEAEEIFKRNFKLPIFWIKSFEV